MAGLHTLSAAVALALFTAVPHALMAQDEQPRPDPEDFAEAEGEPPTLEFADPGRFVHEDGETIYRAACQGCHMPEGEGAQGAGFYPALAGNPSLEFAGYPVFVVVHGLRAMPAFGGYLDDEQVAEVVNFIRTNFGNDFEEEATAEDVEVVR